MTKWLLRSRVYRVRELIPTSRLNCSFRRPTRRSSGSEFFTGRVYESDREAAFKAGDSGYLTKPRDLDNLADQVWKLIRERRAGEDTRD